MKMKVFSILALAGTVMLSGCSANNSKSGTEPTKAAESEAPVDVTWFSTAGFWNPLQWKTESGTFTGEITKKTGLTFSYNIPAQDGDTKLSLLMVSSSDKFPDVITTMGPEISQKLASSGKVWKLEEFLKQYDPESHLLKDFPADIKKTLVKRDGDWYAFPSHMVSNETRKQYPPSSAYFDDLAKFGENKGIVINKNILEQAGLSLDDVKTEDGLLAAFKKVKDMKLTVGGQPVIPLQVSGKTYHGETFQFLQRTFGAMPIDKDGKYRDILLAPETKHAIEFLFKAYKGGAFDAGQLTMDNAALDADRLTGRVFAYIGNLASAQFGELDFWVSPGAILSNQGTKPLFPVWSEPTEGWLQTFISKSTKEPEKVAKWLSYMTSPEGMTLNHFGFEGDQYKKDDKGLIVRTEKGIQEGKEAKTGLDSFWQFANVAWLEHVQPAPTKREGGGGLIEMEAKTAYGRAPEVVRYESSVLNLPGSFYAPGGKNVIARDQIKLYMEAQVSKMLLAKDEAQFNKFYDEYVAQLKALKIDEFDAARDAELQKKSQEMGITVTGVNS